MGKPGSARLVHPNVFNREALKLRPPVVPRADDVKTPAEHPLWQFFGPQRELVRTREQLEGIGAPWTVPQLRRKSFDDLHTLWYVCLKERNRLFRESQLLTDYATRVNSDGVERPANAASDADGLVRTTMWRIRHVLAERFHAHKRFATFDQEQVPALAAEFHEKYLAVDRAGDARAEGMLERFQYAFFGINPRLDGNVPDERVVEGLYTVAALKLARYAPAAGDVRDIREAFLVFGAEPGDDGVAEAVQGMARLRAESDAAPRARDLETLAELLFAVRESQNE